MPVYFYWHAVHWQHNRQKQVGPRQQNVWADPVTFDRRRADGRGEFANGDGVLLFPGTDRLHPAEDRGIAGPIGTVQLANLRRGLQDHLYLTLARQRGHRRWWPGCCRPSFPGCSPRRGARSRSPSRPRRSRRRG